MAVSRIVTNITAAYKMTLLKQSNYKNTRKEQIVLRVLRLSICIICQYTGSASSTGYFITDL